MMYSNFSTLELHMPHRIKYFPVAPEWAKVIIEYVHYSVINF